MTASIHPSIEQHVGDMLLPALDCLRVGVSVFDASDRLAGLLQKIRTR